MVLSRNALRLSHHIISYERSLSYPCIHTVNGPHIRRRPARGENKRTHKRANVISNIAFSAVLVDVLITEPYCMKIQYVRVPRSVETTICIIRARC